MAPLLGGIRAFLSRTSSYCSRSKGWFKLGAQAGLAVKVDEGIDEAGRKVNVMADKAGGAIEQIGNVSADALRSFINSWSKMYIAGTGVKFLLEAAKDTMSVSDLRCAGAWESVNCTCLTLTSISTTSAAIALSIAMALKGYKLLKG